MKKIMGVALTALLVSWLALAAFAAEAKTTFVVKHMCCGNCAKALKGALTKVDGVTEVATTNGAPGEATVTHDDAKTDAKKLIKAAFDAGFVMEAKK